MSEPTEPTDLESFIRRHLAAVIGQDLLDRVTRGVAEALVDANPIWLAGAIVAQRRGQVETAPLSYGLMFTAEEIEELRIGIKQRMATLAEALATSDTDRVRNEVGRRGVLNQSLDTAFAEAEYDLQRRRPDDDLDDFDEAVLDGKLRIRPTDQQDQP